MKNNNKKTSSKNKQTNNIANILGENSPKGAYQNLRVTSEIGPTFSGQRQMLHNVELIFWPFLYTVSVFRDMWSGGVCLWS